MFRFTDEGRGKEDTPKEYMGTAVYYLGGNVKNIVTVIGNDGALSLK